MEQAIKRPNKYLSKSLFIKGLQCHKYLYLEKYHPELRDELSEEVKTKFSSGIEVGLCAHQLFPGGAEIPYDASSYSRQIAETEEEIAKGTTVLYEAAFSFDNIFIKADVLRKGEEGWEFYEVKSSTSVEEIHLNDAALQYYVISNSGFPISRAFLVHINSKYVREGEIDVWKLFAVEDVTDKVLSRQDTVVEALRDMREKLYGGIPDIDIGLHCENPYPCNFMGYCWKHIPEQSVFSIRGSIDAFGLYRQGIIDLKDVALDRLSNAQRIQVECTLQQTNRVDKGAVKQFLNTLWYPLCFLDFETTFMLPIPLFDGTRPYQQVPFQYSLHLTEREGGDPVHYEFLADTGTDPRRGFIESLIERVPDGACIVCYNIVFEKGRLEDCKTWFPEYTQKINPLIENMRDLMWPFKKKDVYYWRMDGSSSLKDVLPAMVPEMSYEGMDIGSGDVAANAWLEMRGMKDPAEIQKTRKALLEYCKLDTLAMVKIVEKLYTLL